MFTKQHEEIYCNDEETGNNQETGNESTDSS